ncbi:MAG TPA: D-alanine--D-alanine ligase [Candidatus Omnitrophica bacterium]|nr:MAG: hypothetical protein A2Z81_09300 [Omnitrophica WOR_2 bacterium GWA2_45_18]HBR15349.1 D-alanine--D-alanine ligase [Candidatus Omnitrophota bacterium]
MKENKARWGRIGVLMGGYSSERPISLKSGNAVFSALRAEGCEVVALDILDREEEKITRTIVDARIDVAFIALHGHLGEDGTIQSILEKIGVPYTGSGPQANRLAINKVSTQNLFKQNAIATPRHVALSGTDEVRGKNIWKELQSLPVVVKPATEGSSIGVQLVIRQEEIGPAVEAARKYSDQVLIESYIQGREMTVGILDQRALPVIEIRPRNGFFDFSAKYQAGMTEYIVPAEIPEATAGVLQKTALQAFRLLGCSDMARVDFILTEDLTPYVLEVNTIPGFTATSLLPKAAKQIGLSFSELCFQLIELAYEKKKKPADPILCRR